MEKRATANIVSRWEPLPENASTMQVMVIPEVDDHPFPYENLPREDLLKFFKYIEQSNKSLEIENMVIERYLNRIDPNALAKMSQILEAAAIALKKIERFAQLGVRKSVVSISKGTTGSKSTFCSSSDSQRTGTTKSSSAKVEFFGLSERGQKVQPLQKIEIVNRELKELKNVLDSFRKKANTFIYNLKCRSEEMSIRLAEIIQAQVTFDEKLLVEDLDPVTGALPGEKFLRHLEKRLKQEEVEVNRLKIKTGCLKNRLKRVKAELSQKREMVLTEELDAIDFEQLKIENQECQEILSEKNFLLKQLKKANKKFENTFNIDKGLLEEQMITLEQFQRNIALKKNLFLRLKESEEIMDSNLIADINSLERVKWLMETYTVPDVIDYIRTKFELRKLKKNLKVKKRQAKLKKMIFNQARNERKRSKNLSKFSDLGKRIENLSKFSDLGKRIENLSKFSDFRDFSSIF